MKSETEGLLQEVLLEQLKFLRRKNEERERERLEQRLAEIRARRWGYPVPKKGRR